MNKAKILISIAILAAIAWFGWQAISQNTPKEAAETRTETVVIEDGQIVGAVEDDEKEAQGPDDTTPGQGPNKDAMSTKESAITDGVRHTVPLDQILEGINKAPNFTLQDNDGNDVSLSDFDGKVRIVNSWAVWCPFCKEELKDFAIVQEEFGDQVVVIAIDRQESLEKTKEFTDSIGVTDKLIFLLDPSDSFYESIGGFSMPETLFIDGERNIIIHKRGPMKADEIREKVQSILGAE